MPQQRGQANLHMHGHASMCIFYIHEFVAVPSLSPEIIIRLPIYIPFLSKVLKHVVASKVQEFIYGTDSIDSLIYSHRFSLHNRIVCIFWCLYYRRAVEVICIAAASEVPWE